jgi:2-keto-4-pentenoate hydratase/2-oxohepta-3-ene-1,7-dioic acid hydratase in catechol pathway
MAASTTSLRMTSAPVRLARYRMDGAVHVGRVMDDAFARLSGFPWSGGEETGTRDPRDAVTLLAPVEPTKIVCVGLNYRAHIAESASVIPGTPLSNEPLIFLKPPSAVIASGEEIQYPAGVERLDPEGELAIVIARRARHVPLEAAADHIAGWTCFNDVSARNFQRSDGQWTRAKGFDTFAPLGPWIALGAPPASLDVECRVNGERRQHGNTADLLFPVPFLVSFISRIMTLEPGDVIATGTPAGVAPVSPGDRVEIEVEGVGILSNRIQAARP